MVSKIWEWPCRESEAMSTCVAPKPRTVMFGGSTAARLAILHSLLPSSDRVKIALVMQKDKESLDPSHAMFS